MTDYYTQASFRAITNVTPAEEAWLKEELSVDPEDIDPQEQAAWAKLRGIDDPDIGWGFEWDFRVDRNGKRYLWVYNDETIDLEHTCGFLQYFIRVHRNDYRICFEYANTTNGLALDAYGGGAVYISQDSIEILSTREYLDKLISQKEENSE